MSETLRSVAPYAAAKVVRHNVIVWLIGAEVGTSPPRPTRTASTARGDHRRRADLHASEAGPRQGQGARPCAAQLSLRSQGLIE